MVAEVTHDVFISYSHEDRDWVVEELKPRLVEAHLSVVLDEEDFQIGTFAVSNMVEAVQKCRHVVAVVTEDWLSSKWAEYEALVQRSQSPTGEKGRLWPLVFVTHDRLPPYLQHLTYADFAQPAHRPREMSKLLKQLGLSQQHIDEINAQFAKKGLGELIQLMRAPEIRDAAGDFLETLHEAREQIAELVHYKELHDLFQVAEQQYNLAFKDWQLVRAEVHKWGDLESPAGLLNDQLQQVLDLAVEFLPVPERTWSPKLKVAQSRLREAIQLQESESLNWPMEQFRDAFGRVPLRLNDRLVEVAKKVQLDKLVAKLHSIEDRMRQIQFQGEALKRSSSFRNGVNSLDALKVSLSRFVDHHNILQGIDHELRRYDFLRGLSALDDKSIVQDWQYLKEMTVGLNSEEDPHKPNWMIQLQQIHRKLSELCANATAGPAQSSSEEKAQSKEIKKLFRSFYDAVTIGSNRVDSDLKKLCGRLREVGDKLGEILGGMENGNR